MLPPDADVVMLLCDDIRQEQGNKFTILGFFTGGDVWLPHDVPDLTLPSFCVLFWIRGGDGKVQISSRVVSPSGNVLMDNPPTNFELHSGKGSAAIMKFMPFKPEVGTYRAELVIDSQHYQRPFEVIRQPPPAGSKA